MSKKKLTLKEKTTASNSQVEEKMKNVDKIQPGKGKRKRVGEENEINDEDDQIEDIEMSEIDEPSEDEKEVRKSIETDEESVKQSPIIESDGKYRNKQRCLVLSSRGVTARYRHLLEDLRTLLPHHKKDYKLDPGRSGGIGNAVNEICEVMSCNSFIFLECKKRMDAYLWLGFAPNGPSAKFYLWNVHTMDELRLTGNCMKGSRPVLSFDENFDNLPHLKLLKVLLTSVFGTPRGHPKSKPFVDRVMGFYFADQKIWVRNYQIVEERQSVIDEESGVATPISASKNTSLVEIGPRFVLNPIKIFSGSLSGQVLYQNNDFVSPNEIRAKEKIMQGKGYDARIAHMEKRREYVENLVIVSDPLDSVFR